MHLSKNTPQIAMELSAKTHQWSLDCSTREAAEASLVAAFGCPASELRTFLANRALNETWNNIEGSVSDWPEWLLQQTAARFGAPPLPIETYWFHGTRVPAGTTFKQGLVPLGAWLPHLKSLIVETLEDSCQIRAVEVAFESEGRDGEHFRNKIQQPAHWGPFGTLVREIALRPRGVAQRKYQEMPELVEDLAAEVKFASGLDILPCLKKRWVPAFVKFRTPARHSDWSAIAAALCYLYDISIHGKPGNSASAWFDGNNNPVPAADIVEVEWL